MLVGGQSRRMGTDKFRLKTSEGTLLETVVRRYAKGGQPVLLGVRDQDPRYGDWPQAPDAVPGAGPLSSLAGLLQSCKTPFLLAVPCDMPCLPEILGDRLLEHMPGVEAVALKCGPTVEPFPAMLSAESAPEFLKWVEQGERKADTWMQRMPSRYVPFEDLFPGVEMGQAMRNLNTQDEYARWMREI